MGPKDKIGREKERNQGKWESRVWTRYKTPREGVQAAWNTSWHPATPVHKQDAVTLAFLGHPSFSGSGSFSFQGNENHSTEEESKSLLWAKCTPAETQFCRFHICQDQRHSVCIWGGQGCHTVASLCPLLPIDSMNKNKG